MVQILQIIIFTSLLLSHALAADAWQIYGIGHLSENQNLNSKFKTSGDALFLISNLQRGISKGDIIRFRDKAILIDDDVWEFLRSRQILSRIKQSPLQISRASAQSQTWSQHAQKKQTSSSRKAYQLGSELLKVMETYFGSKSGDSEFHIQFRNGKMIFTADKSFFDQLKFRPVRPKLLGGRPQIISLKPDSLLFVNTNFYWQAWAIAQGNASETLKYTLQGKVPPGLKWNPKDHQLEGTLDSLGKWELTLVVSNTKNQKDSLDFTIQSRFNQAPQFGRVPQDTIYTEEVYRYKPKIYDHDHPVEDLHFRYQSSHSNLSYSKYTQEFIVKPGQEMNGEYIQLDMFVYDLEGDTTWLSHQIQVLSQSKKIQTQNLSTSIPFDTLISHHTYTWDITEPLKEIKRDQMQLVKVEGPDSIWIRQNKVFIYPRINGPFPVHFKVKAGKDTIDFKKEFFVTPNQIPKFHSTLDKNVFEQDEDIIHKPIAIDSDLDPTSIQVIYSSDSTSYQYQLGELKLMTDTPGSYLLELQAKDSTGASSYQVLSWEVKEIKKDWYGGQYQYMHLGEFNFHQLHYENAMGRFGVLTSQSDRIFSQDAPYQTFPFIFAGLNMLNSRRAREGDYFFVDLGISFRKPHEKLITGGVYSGFTSRIHYLENNWVSEMDFKLISNQVILLLDTNDFFPEGVSISELLELAEGSSDHLTNQQKRDINKYQTGQKGKSLRQVTRLLAREYGDPNNITCYFRFENLIPIQPWLLLGPSQLLQYYHVYNDLHLSNGVVARHWVHGTHYRLEHNFRLHYAPITKYQLGYELKISLGMWN